MSKRRQGPINKRLDFINNKLNKYSIRKFTVGTASILVGATLIFGHADDEAKAAEENHMENTSLNSIENDEDKNNQKVDSSNETATTLTEKTTTKEAPSSEENTEDVTTKEAPSSEENTEDVTTKEDNTEEVATKEDNTEEVATKEDNTEEVATKEDN
ncbi:YSIRK-type signal peptide-containing protein, partial [Staphylococcus haemolyticus]|uniref:YSIRK-type signal peptide-containing protein n=2 Tax=Staphylococcus haemolyticus TaxID=1283 RepID=UPI001F0A0B9A